MIHNYYKTTLVTAILMTLPSLVQAQTLEEVIVTAQKRI